MRHEASDFVFPQSVAAGDAKLVERFHEKTVQFLGTWVGTAQLQGKLASKSGPGAHDVWINIGAAVTGGTPVFVAVDPAVTHLRVNVTAYTSGQGIAVFGGFDSRTES